MVLKPLKNELEIKSLISMGDEKAFKVLFESYAPALYQFIFSVIKCEKTSEEILNDIFLKLWNQKEQLQSINSLTDYIFIICRNYSLNALRSLSKNKMIDIDSVSEKDFLSFEQKNENDKIELLHNAIKKLPPQQQKVILLKQNGFKNEEAALEMQLSVHSIKKYQKLAIDNLSKTLKVIFCLYFS